MSGTSDTPAHHPPMLIGPACSSGGLIQCNTYVDGECNKYALLSKSPSQSRALQYCMADLGPSLFQKKTKENESGRRHFQSGAARICMYSR